MTSDDVWKLVGILFLFCVVFAVLLVVAQIGENVRKKGSNDDDQ